MAKSRSKSTFICESCGNETPKWEGRCATCGEWNTIFEVEQRKGRRAPVAWLRETGAEVQELASVSMEDLPRLQVSSSEINRVLGGGVVPGSVVLVAGDPGIGKSTLLLRLAADVTESIGPALYVSGEESASQVRLRAERLGLSNNRLLFLSATDIHTLFAALEQHRPSLAIVDSIQTVHDDEIPSASGTIAQIRECTRHLLEWAKASNTPIVLTGHVTKGGDIAGPRVLEHMVDVVLQMEGDPISSWRLLRATKNRFGSTNEVGVFEMTGSGLTEVEDPSRTFLSERVANTAGSVVVATMEGSRPLLAEVQALTSPSVLPSPRRSATGIDINRLLLVSAVLTRRAGLPLSSQDIIVNVTGGLRIIEPAADLGLALAIVSSARDMSVDPDVVAVGEIGLSGEVRRVPQIERRIEEAARLGLRRCLVPANARSDVSGIDLVPVSTVSEAVLACMNTERTPDRLATS